MLVLSVSAFRFWTLPPLRLLLVGSYLAVHKISVDELHLPLVIFLYLMQLPLQLSHLNLLHSSLSFILFQRPQLNLEIDLDGLLDFYVVANLCFELLRLFFECTVVLRFDQVGCYCLDEVVEEV